MPKNHSRYTWGQAGADIGTCKECGKEKRVIDEFKLCKRCRHLCKAWAVYMDMKQREYEHIGQRHLDHIRAREGQ